MNATQRRLLGVTLLVLLEGVALSLVADRPVPGLASLANRQVASGLLFAWISLIWIVRTQGSENEHHARSRSWWVRAFTIHAAAITLLAALLRHGDLAPERPWILGVTAILAFLAWAATAAALALGPSVVDDLRSKVQWWFIACGSLGLIVALALPWIHRLWKYQPIWRPTLLIACWTAAPVLGGAMAGQLPDGRVILGSGNHWLLVTPGCSELDAHVTWTLLGVLPALTMRTRIRWAGWGLVATLGCMAWTLINGIRLGTLLILASRWNADHAVAMAHSRLSWVLGLATGILWWCITRPLWLRGPRTRPGGKDHRPEPAPAGGRYAGSGPEKLRDRLQQGPPLS